MSAMFDGLFIQDAVSNPRYYVMVVFTVVVSIVLHELAHGWMAIRRGDHTPIHMGRMTGNPLVHMGPFSILVMLFFGIAWGQMPVDPTRLRGRYAEAMVAAAGPATNFLLGAAALTGLGLWYRFGQVGDTVQWQKNLVFFLYVFGSTNLMLLVFNLFPVPPLDGAHILANFHRGYANFIFDPHNQQYVIFGFIFVFVTAGMLFDKVIEAALRYVVFVSGDATILNTIFR